MSFEIANIKNHGRERERTPIGSDEPRALLFFRIWQNFLVSSIFKNLPWQTCEIVIPLHNSLFLSKIWMLKGCEFSSQFNNQKDNLRKRGRQLTQGIKLQLIIFIGYCPMCGVQKNNCSSLSLTNGDPEPSSFAKVTVFSQRMSYF